MTSQWSSAPSEACLEGIGIFLRYFFLTILKNEMETKEKEKLDYLRTYIHNMTHESLVKHKTNNIIVTLLKEKKTENKKNGELVCPRLTSGLECERQCQAYKDSHCRIKCMYVYLLLQFSTHHRRG